MQKNIRLLTLFNFFTDFVFFAPIAIIYFARVTGSYALGMSIFSIAYLTSAVFEVPTGILSDLVGRKKTFILGSFFGTLCIVFYAIGINYWIMIMGAITQGLARSFFSGNNNAFLHDTLKEMGREGEYHTILGKTSSMFQIALALASLIGGFLASISFSLAMWLSVLPQICCLIISFYFKEPDVQKEESGNIYYHLKESLKQFRENYNLKLLTITSSIRFSIGESMFFLNTAFINSLWPIWALGIARTLSHIFGALGFYFSGKLINRFSAIKILISEIYINRILTTTAYLFPTTISPLLMSATSFSFGTGTTAQDSLLQKEFTENQRATMGSLNSLIGSIFFGIISILMGFLGDTIGIRNTLLIATFILFFPLIIYRKIFSRIYIKNNL